MAKQEKGIVFPKNLQGRRSTIDFQVNLINTLLYDDELIDSSITQIKKTFRNKYPRYYKALFSKFLKSKNNAITLSDKALELIEQRISFIRSETNTEVSLKEEMSSNHSNPFDTQSTAPEFPSTVKQNFSVPYKGRKYSEGELKSQISAWNLSGVMEKDAADALIKIIDNPSEINLEGKCFILIGAASAMGPLKTLLDMGATVIALDIPRKEIWDRIISIARNASSSNAKLIYPSQNNIPGCNILEQPAEIANWLVSLNLSKDYESVVIGNYTYLDGALHVLLSAASDVIINSLCHSLKANLSVSLLCTPTDISLIPKSAYAAARRNMSFSLSPKKIFDILLRLLSFGQWLRPNQVYKENGLYVYNGLTVVQGPNYAMAKNIQLWRALHCAHWGKGIVSLNVAPATATLSVVHSRTFRWAFEGMEYFSPIEIFRQETSSALMAGLLIHDIIYTRNSKNEIGKHPLELKSTQAIHGGMWRCAYSQDSIGTPSVLVHFMGGPKKVIFVLYSILAILILLLLV